MQKMVDPGVAKSPLQNPLLDFWIAGAEAQLKAWQAYQVEGTRFVAKRLHANLEYLRSLGHCGEAQSMSQCQQAWLAELHKDYTEECGRLAGTSVALTLSTLGPVAWTGSQRSATVAPEVNPRRAA